MADLAEHARPAIEPNLAPGETLEGIVAATHSKTFSGTLYGIGVTPERLILQPLDRKFNAKGEAILVTPDRIKSAKLEGGGGDWWTATSSIMDATSLAVKLDLDGGPKLTLRMMKGGDGFLGGLGGGESQGDGVLALVAWMQRHLAH